MPEPWVPFIWPCCLRRMLTSGRAVQTQGRNIRHYYDYLVERVRAYRDTKIDWVRGRENRLEKLSVEKGLLRETESVQKQLTALLKCDVRCSQASIFNHFC